MTHRTITAIALFGLVCRCRCVQLEEKPEITLEKFCPSDK